MNYRKIWEQYNDRKIPKDYHIHHIDGNRNNNHPDNLLCCSIEEHAKIHYNRWEKYKLESDKIAWLGLSNLISSQEVFRLACRLSAKNPDRIAKIAAAGRGRIPWNKGLTKYNDPRIARTQKTREKMQKVKHPNRKKRGPWPEEWKQEQKLRMKKWWEIRRSQKISPQIVWEPQVLILALEQ
jgi:hypothetical protein